MGLGLVCVRVSNVTDDFGAEILGNYPSGMRSNLPGSHSRWPLGLEY